MSQVKVNFQTNDDASFKIGFNDNQRYLNNGEIVFPKNSLGYIVDESELITLVKPCGDPYISFKITDTQFANLAAFEDWFAENAVSSGGGGGIDPETLAELVSSAEYVSSSSTIDFKNVDGEVISTINAEPFITDGMVDNVQISGSNLVITFNVDAGKQPISIPLTDIFNPSNYYDKTATDALLSGKADVSAVTVDEYSIYATRDNIISTAYTSTPITWVKITPKGNLGKSGSLQFSGVTGYLYIQNIDYVNGTYTVGSGSLDPSLVSGLSITFEDGAMIVEVDASNPITYASFSNTVIEYVKTVIPEKVVSDAVYDNLYPLIGKVDNSLKSVTVNSASTVQQEIGIRQTKNDGGSTNQIVSLDGYLSYSGTTLKAEAYVNTGTDTLTTVSPTINSSSRTDYYFTDNVGQTEESNHIEIQILTGDTINLAFYGYDNRGMLTSRSLVVSGGTVTSGHMWPSEAIYSFSNDVLTVDYAYTGTSANTPLTINRIMATNQYGSTASVSDIVGYVKALLKDKVEVTEYIENTLKPTIDDIEDSLSGKQDTLQYYTEGEGNAVIEVPSANVGGVNGVFVYQDGVEIYADGYVSLLKIDTGGTATINGDAVATVPMLSGKADTSAVTAVADSLSGKQDTLVSGTNIKTINNTSLLGSGNIDIQGGGGATYSAGTNISIDTANTINCTLNLVNGGGTNSVKMKNTHSSNGSNSFAIGSDGVKASGLASFAGGSYSEANQMFSMAFGRYAIANNYGEVALGYFNKSNGSSTAVTNSSGDTLFSVGNGTSTSESARHNAFEIRKNGDIYCSDGTNDVKLQDTITATAANTTALGGLSLVKLTQAQYDALVTKDANTLYIIDGTVNNNS